ncbi:hypothetical protein [Bacillus cereus]|uniref:hypothetical protein n=1 Tax=Bacillus cereus TaxID=1396 RepID=UPI0015CF1851|nr:hypothetical protein [Bacillus cereus]
MENKKVYIGEVHEKEIDYGNSNEFYHDVHIGGTNDYLTDELYKFEGKKVKVTIEVIE